MVAIFQILFEVSSLGFKEDIFWVALNEGALSASFDFVPATGRPKSLRSENRVRFLSFICL